MAGRFLFQKLASRMSRSTSLLGAHAWAPVTRRASEGGVRTLNNSSYGPVAHPSTAVPNNPGIHGYEGDIRTLCNIFNRASTQPSTPLPSIRGIHGSLGRHLSTLHCARAASLRSNPPKCLPPVITDRIEPSLVDYVRANGTSYWAHKLSAREAEWQARREAAIAASKAECAAWDAKWKAKDAAFDRFVMIILGQWYEYAPLIFALNRDGFTPPSIEEATGVFSVEQNRLVDATQVRDSLLDEDAFPDDLIPNCIAFWCFRAAREAIAVEDCIAELEHALQVVETKAARARLQLEMDRAWRRAAGEEVDAAVDDPASRPDLPVVPGSDFSLLLPWLYHQWMPSEQL
ncbi:hypothetical protein EJB05_47635 [Eragrostis curvula]|uniref:Rubisco accumulation factor 1 helix turn helix domain-containing protein n=1 Tax=Eragrostis curvula TaxID=38414 RepID=A0A5J9SZW6_9POAL|nr:hypothetical protein EJB05_47635 [Eragrostis curvula]